MPTTKKDNYAIASHEAHDLLNKTVGEWLKLARPDYTCVGAALELAGGDPYMAEEQLSEIHSFLMDVFRFFCIPEHAAAFNKISPLYPQYRKEDWPTILLRLTRCVAQLTLKYPLAEMVQHETSMLVSLQNHQVESLMKEYKAAA